MILKTETAWLWQELDNQWWYLRHRKPKIDIKYKIKPFPIRADKLNTKKAIILYREYKKSRNILRRLILKFVKTKKENNFE